MMRVLIVLVAFSAGAEAARLIRDVPVGECHICEVTCFEDCMLKYDREILQDDNFLQIDASKNQTKKTAERVQKLSKEYATCLGDDKCPCPKEEAKAAAKVKGKVLLQKNTSCALGDNSSEVCAQNCSRKIVSKNEESLKKQVALAKPAKKAQLIQRDYPIHSVTVGVFSKGAMNMDECLKFCMAATCGCNKSPGLDTIDKLYDAIKANDAAQPGEKDFSHRGDGSAGAGMAVADTNPSEKYRPAKIEECAKGMIGKKVAKGLYIDFGGGVGGEIEICSKKMLEKIFGPGGHPNKEKLCKSTKSDDAQWGCVWNEKKGYCGVGFSPNLHCLVKYFNDPSTHHCDTC